MERPLLLLRLEHVLLHTLLYVLYVKLASIILLFFLQNNTDCYMDTECHLKLLPIALMLLTILLKYHHQIMLWYKLLLYNHNYLYYIVALNQVHQVHHQQVFLGLILSLLIELYFCLS